MVLIADILLIAAALGAAFYCISLSRKLNKFSDLEGGVGGAISELSAQVSEMSETLKRAETAAGTSSASLADTTERAEAAARRIELLLASLHDLPESEESWSAPPQKSAPEAKPDAAESPNPTFLRRARPGARGS